QRRGVLDVLVTEPEERELVGDRRLAAAAVAAHPLAAVVLLDRDLVLERHHRLLLAQERHRERTPREVVAVVAATATGLGGRRAGEREVLGAMGLAQVDLIDHSGGEIGDQRARTVGGYREAARLARERGAPALASGGEVIRHQRAVCDRRDQQQPAIGG